MDPTRQQLSDLMPVLQSIADAIKAGNAGQINMQVQNGAGTNGVVNTKKQVGWGFMTTPGGVGTVGKTVTFPKPFLQIFSIQVTNLGYKAGSDPTSIFDFTGGGSENSTPISTSLTGMNVVTFTNSGGNFGANERHGFAWEITGIY